MGNTYISIQAVFAVQSRGNFITSEWRDNLHRYIAGIIQKEATSLAVGGWKDHVHIFMGLPPVLSISEMLKLVKANSSKWINTQKFTRGKFQWQEGYSAFSYSKSQRDAVINYIMKQEEHHRMKTFKEEYLDMLKNFEVDYNEKYLFEFYE